MCKRCEALEEHVRTNEETIAKQEEAIQVLERKLTVQLMQNGKLSKQRERELGEGNEAAIVIDVIDYWKAATGHEKAKVSAAGKRGDAVRKALRLKFTPEEIKEAIDGAAKYPFVVNKQRASAGTSKERYDGLETILRDEVQIEKFRDLAGRPVLPGANEPKAEEDLTWAERIRQANYPLARVTAALWDHAPDFDATDPDRYTATCPVHFGPGLVVTRNDAGIMSIECERGCEFWRLLAALQLQPADLFENAEHDPGRRSADAQRKVPAHLTEAAGLLMSRLSGVARS